MSIRQIVDANEAVARVAYAMSEVIAIYPITPASPMGEFADAWRSMKRPNLFGTLPEVIEMQSEGGAAGVVHGALQAGSLATTFTASQGLLLMIPNMYKIAGELTPTVFHVAARTIATHALSIFGDHSDVMACRGTGWAMLCSSTVQEAQDFAAIAHAATLKSRVPFLHFFDGFRTSHELNCIEPLADEEVRGMIDTDAVDRHRQHGLNPDAPVLRGTAQNPDVFFQAREAINPFYDALPNIVQETMDAFAHRTGRDYRLVEYYGAPDADRVLVLMGSGVGAAEECVDALRRKGEKVGLIKIRLARPLDCDRFLEALPDTVRRISVLDRTKEPGAIGEPSHSKCQAMVVGGRYGLASKEFTPAMAAAVFQNLEEPTPKRGFTVGIVDDVTHRSLHIPEDFIIEHPGALEAMFFGLGSDGTVGANKNTVKILADNTPLFAQGYFVYDSKKSGAMTISHVRVSPHPIRATYLIQQADFIGCHQFSFLDRIDVLERAKVGSTLLLNAPYTPDRVWEHLPSSVKKVLIERRIRVFAIDAESIARKVGMPGRINILMQVCFFALSEMLPLKTALSEIRSAIEKTYGKRGSSVIEKNFAAVDAALAELHEIPVPKSHDLSPVPSAVSLPEDVASDFVTRVTRIMMSGRGDSLPVSAMPVDGTFPTGTAAVEKRSIATQIPIWEPDLCIQCGLCSLVCPHAAIRMKAFEEEKLSDAPESFATRPWTGKDLPGHRMVIQVAPDDCTGCGVCVDVCPARSKEAVKIKAINMTDKRDHLERERSHFDFFLKLPAASRTAVDPVTVKGSQHLLPLFEFSGACAGCGETPYLKLVSQLFGDRMVVANATGCSSIYGGNLPTTPWSTDDRGRGPAWANSLFEDNAEFGLGLRLAWDQRERMARSLLRSMSAELPSDLVDGLLGAEQGNESELAQKRERIDQLRKRLADLPSTKARELEGLADALVRRSVWIIGGDGWAYDIGFGGLDHVLASGKDVNVLVLDTEVYSNTGGQASKSTPRGAVAKFATAGKGINKKDIGMIAMAYGHVYVAQIAIGAHPLQALKAFSEAESYRGPSLILAYSQCIAHGIDMTTGMTHQKDAVNSGYWPLYRFDPRIGHDGGKPFHLDSRKPSMPLKQFATKEARFSMLMRSDPERAEQLLRLAQIDIDDRWHYYEQIANVERSMAGLMDEVHV
ncbi:MAG: pyruvate:ferredoxin (flavodoxin) oxidoreductase [Pirellula sp.]|nr:pyruvate:ferredoxin (flavodoxin) oxidoreductase [Pirellula sp.]